jgi:hypothetical protein
MGLESLMKFGAETRRKETECVGLSMEACKIKALIQMSSRRWKMCFERRTPVVYLYRQSSSM